MRIAAFTLLLTFFSACQKQTEDSVLQYVDPFIGTGFHGHTFPGATVPFGMVQVSPDTHLMGWEASSGYHYPDSLIYGFSHTHLSGTGIGDMGDVLLIPYSGEDKEELASVFSKDTEAAQPGYYTVRLDDHAVKVELSSTKRVGIHRYRYEHSDSRKVMLDLSHILQANWGHRMMANSFKITSDQTVEGIQKTKGWAHDHIMAYHISFSEPFTNCRMVVEGQDIEGKLLEAKEGQVYFHFEASDKPLLVKVALSPVDAGGALRNMQAEMPGWDFEGTVAASQKEWEEALQGIDIHTQDETIKTNFYTALYHCMMSPFTYQDVDGRYRGMNKQVMQAPEGFTNYTVFSLWDTFRAFHPLMTIIRPEKAKEWAHSLVQKHHEGGILPKWPLVSNYTGTMVGYPATSVLADAVVKGLGPDDISEWMEAAVKAATYQPELVEKFRGTREAGVMPKHIYFKETMGFVPGDSVAESVSYGLEMAYYDWCVAQLAKAAGENDVYDEFKQKAAYFRQYFDPETGLMRGKMGDGSWRTPFKPRYSSHEKSDYVEGNAWQWSFFVPHANEELIDLYGSKDAFEAMLDTLFTTDSTIEGEHASGDITGLIGQYAHGNEPSHHMAYLYNWTNAPWKGQERIDQILNDFYLPEPAGIIGNEDCGQMSAWYVLSAMGIYQVCPGDPAFALGRPLLDKAVIAVPGGQFTIVAENNSKQNKFVKEVRLNNQALESLFISYEDIMKGGTLQFVMTGDKNQAWKPMG
jgi:predicted alpha-1,2-mannosidase